MARNKYLFNYRDLAETIEKPLDLRYNPYTQSIESVEDAGSIMDIATEVRGDLKLICKAIRNNKASFEARK